MRGTVDIGFGRVSEVYDLKGEKGKWVKQGHYYNLIFNKEGSSDALISKDKEIIADAEKL